MRCEVLHCQEELRLSEELYEDWCEEVEENRLRIISWKKEAAVAGSSREARVGVVISWMEVKTMEVEECLSTMATLCWAKGVWKREQRKAWRKHIFEVQT